MLSFEKMIREGEADEKWLYFLLEKLNKRNYVLFLLFVQDPF